MDSITRKFVTFLFAMWWAFLTTLCAQWMLGCFDITPKIYWFQGAFLVLTLLFWSPWRKRTLPPKNDGNNELFPGQ